MKKEEIFNRNNISHKERLAWLFFISLSLWLLWLLWGRVSNEWLVIQPKNLKSIFAIITSNFFHGNSDHLYGNLIFFCIIGYFCFWYEGRRTFSGIIYGALGTGLVQFFVGDKTALYLGFSGIIFALIGILFVASIRKGHIFIIALVCIGMFLLGSSFFDTIRPTYYALLKNISWQGHLGGFIGGIWSQVRNLKICLEMLLEADIINEQEFLQMENRITKNSIFNSEPTKNTINKTNT